MKILKYGIFTESMARTDSSLPVLERTSELSENEFLEVLNENCKNFSFDNTQLWRSKYKKFDLELFKPAARNADPLAFKNFFNDIENKTDEYPVVRKNSLIGGTDKEICKRLVGADMYLVIPFDNSEIVFCPIMDLWAMADDRRISKSDKSEFVNGKPVSKDDFIKVSYTENFQYLDKGKGGHGCEYFISSPCLLVHESKIDWLKENMNK